MKSDFHQIPYLIHPDLWHTPRSQYSFGNQRICNKSICQKKCTFMGEDRVSHKLYRNLASRVASINKQKEAYKVWHSGLQGQNYPLQIQPIHLLQTFIYGLAGRWKFTFSKPLGRVAFWANDPRWLPFWSPETEMGKVVPSWVVQGTQSNAVYRDSFFLCLGFWLFSYTCEWRYSARFAILAQHISLSGHTERKPLTKKRKPKFGNTYNWLEASRIQPAAIFWFMMLFRFHVIRFQCALSSTGKDRKKSRPINRKWE